MPGKHLRRRAALVAALAAGTLAGALAPIASATQNTGRGPAKLSASTCKSLRDLANQDSDNAAAAYERGDKATGRDDQMLADQDYDTARKGGCAWAQRVLGPTTLGRGGTRSTYGG